MTAHGATLQNHFQNLTSIVENLKMKKYNIQKLIEVQEQKKIEIEKEIENARSRINEVEENLNTLKTAQNDVDSTISKAGEAFLKIEQNTLLLLTLTRRTGDELDKILDNIFLKE